MERHAVVAVEPVHGLGRTFHDLRIDRMQALFCRKVAACPVLRPHDLEQDGVNNFSKDELPVPQHAHQLHLLGAGLFLDRRCRHLAHAPLEIDDGVGDVRLGESETVMAAANEFPVGRPVVFDVGNRAPGLRQGLQPARERCLCDFREQAFKWVQLGMFEEHTQIV